MMRCGQQLRRPFTLMEIMVVVIIIAMVFGLILPRLGHLPSGVVIRGVEGSIRSAFRDAANRARAIGVVVKVSVDHEANVVKLEEVAGRTADLPTLEPDPSTAPTGSEEPKAKRYSGSMTYTLPKGFEWVFTGDQNQQTPSLFYFYPNGEAATTECVEIQAGGHHLRIDVDRLTGRPLLSSIDR